MLNERARRWRVAALRAAVRHQCACRPRIAPIWRAGLRSAMLSEERWLEKLSLEPLLLHMPLVRNQQQSRSAPRKETWNTWYALRNPSADPVHRVCDRKVDLA